MIKTLILSLVSILLSTAALSAAQARIQVQVPKTAYIQWLRSPSERMTQAFASHTDLRFQGGGRQGGEVAEVYLGVMCNSTAGYELRFTARDVVDRDTALARGAGGVAVPYNVSLQGVGSSLGGSVNLMTNLDLTGGSSSVSVSYGDSLSLPLKADRPNVFRLRATSNDPIPSGQIMTGGITVQVVVR